MWRAWRDGKALSAARQTEALHESPQCGSRAAESAPMVLQQARPCLDKTRTRDHAAQCNFLDRVICAGCTLGCSPIYFSMKDRDTDSFATFSATGSAGPAHCLFDALRSVIVLGPQV